MFAVTWVTLLLSVRGSDTNTGTDLSASTTQHCPNNGYCIRLSQGEITAEAGLCVVIPCSFTVALGFTPTSLVWSFCEALGKRCYRSYGFNNRPKAGDKGLLQRMSLLEPDLNLKNCSVMISDLRESDTGSYLLRVKLIPTGSQSEFPDAARASVYVKGLTQKPTVEVPALTEGQQSTLTCTAPGLCSGSPPRITWTWTKKGEKDSHIDGNITKAKTESLTAVAQRHSSTLTFDPSAEHHNTNISCRISFTENITTEETVTLKVNSEGLKAGGCFGGTLSWVVAGVSIGVNVFCIFAVWFLWRTRESVKPKEEENTYTSLRKTDVSPEYDVLAPVPR